MTVMGERDITIWSEPDVLKFMRRPLLRELRERGALSMPELDGTGLEVMSNPLTSSQIRTLLDSARRLQLVAALGGEERPGGYRETEAEWVLTDRGRQEISGLPSLLAKVGSRAVAAVTFLALLGVGGLLRDLDVRWADIIIYLGLPLLALAAGALTLISQERQESVTFKVASDWSPLESVAREKREFRQLERRHWRAMYPPYCVLAVCVGVSLFYIVFQPGHGDELEAADHPVLMTAFVVTFAWIGVMTIILRRREKALKKTLNATRKARSSEPTTPSSRADSAPPRPTSPGTVS